MKKFTYAISVAILGVLILFVAGFLPVIVEIFGYPLLNLVGILTIIYAVILFIFALRK